MVCLPSRPSAPLLSRTKDDLEHLSLLHLSLVAKIESISMLISLPLSTQPVKAYGRSPLNPVLPGG